jgi:hypothetical protein
LQKQLKEQEEELRAEDIVRYRDIVQDELAAQEKEKSISKSEAAENHSGWFGWLSGGKKKDKVGQTAKEDEVAGQRVSPCGARFHTDNPPD